MKHAYRWTALLALSLLSACGGSSHSSPAAPMAFTIGGSITGLTASGLVLLDNGGDTLDVAANTTSFMFPTALGSGIGYAVTIHTQPTGLTCSVSNATGTISSANVTNVSVSCSATPTYTIGGSITGLTASGLTLASGSDTATVAASATSYNLSPAVLSGTMYDVVITNQPTGETCTVANPTGTVSAASVTNVSVSCSATPTYTIGGSITGLTASGLTLASGSDTATVAASATSYNLSPAVLSGTMYDVVITNQPTGETCTVANPTGTVSAASVTNVSVSCSATPTYTIGGSVTGLTASGLTLASGSDTATVAASATSYNLSPAVLSGTMYDVVITNQPTGETCTVANPTGTVSAASVTNVSVSCSATPTYTIGGSITGLTASGLTLASGSDTATVAASATSYNLSPAVLSGTMYDVVITNQPTGETCTVANPTGTVSAASVTNVSVSCSATPTYTIGGSVTGLTASGLTLASGSDTATVATSATSYNLSPAVLSGTVYDVVITNQPTGETCTVANPAGTVGAANVTNANVACTTNTPPVTYTIGGTVEGLTAAGLVLQDNGGDNYSATAGTAFPFTFATALTSGATYAVTVQTQPTGETCVVSDGSGTASANVTTVIVSCSQYAASLGTNVVVVTVGNGPTAAMNPTFNIPYVTVKVCEPSSPTTCAIINNVEVDTGSVGLRLLASALASPDGGSPVTLPSFADPSTPANTISECWHFGGLSDAWGAVATADVDIGGESGSIVEVQVINDGTPAPNNCSGTQFGTVTDFDANGVLGVGVMQQDCGTGCETPVTGDFYYSCSTASSSSCTQVGLTTTAQVPNPVLSFADNNGVILQLPAVPATGLATANGYLVFGIGTAAGDNSLGGATVLTADTSGYITTSFADTTTASGLFDTGTNYLAFSDSLNASLVTCSDNVNFYCPTSPSTTLSLTANNEGANSNTSAASFQITNLDDLVLTSSSDFALNDVGGPDSSLFDWGLPFFYGRTVFVGIQDTTYPNGYYAY